MRIANALLGIAHTEVRAFLTVRAAAERRGEQAGPPHTAGRSDPTVPGGLIPITLTAEIARLLILMDRQPSREERIRHGLRWSRWRRLHQAIARACHRRRHQRRNSTRPSPTTTPRTTANNSIYD